MLDSRYKKYLDLLPIVQDKYGFIDYTHCDSLLFTGLLGCVPEVEIKIEAAFDTTTGLWHRRPIENPCFDCVNKKDVGAKSSISRDMLLGLAYYIYYNKRLDISEQLIRRALTNWGFMGEAIDDKTKWGRCQIMPPLFSTFCWISHKLGGPSRKWARWIPVDYGAHLDDYQAHLQVLHILLRKELYRDTSAKLTKIETTALQYQSRRQPNNPLFLHAVGRDMEALEILSDNKLWPEDRLPRRSDRKAFWLPMRDYGEEWKPDISSADLIPHSGGDLLFLWWLIGKKYAL